MEELNIMEWVHLFIRWTHVFAGILWIGQTALFSFLDSRLKIEADSDGKEKIWLVHSGGFYVVHKQTKPELMPKILHGFKWESLLSWLSGFLLLFLVYYHGGILLRENAGITNTIGIIIGIFTLIVGWAVYDFFWRSPLAKNDIVGGIISLVLLFLIASFLNYYFEGRAVYIHIGALLGTLMTANVWMRILPPQRRMLKALKEDKEINIEEAKMAKTRSKHNTFMAVPVVFIMISNHFPTTTYGSSNRVIILTVLILIGFLVRKCINKHDDKPLQK